MSVSTVALSVLWLASATLPYPVIKGVGGTLPVPAFPPTLKTRRDAPPRNMTITTPLREALNDAISSGRFIDTQIILFSRRDGSRRVCKPKALYANSHVLKSVPYFDSLLFGPFSESEDKYFSEVTDDGEFADDYGYSSDSDLEEDCDFENPGLPQLQWVPLQPEASHGEYKEHVRSGKVIKIRDVAFITFQAFLLYLYTDSVKFAPFGSKRNRESRSTEIAWAREGEIPKPSPKSIYRLADKYDVPALKEAALKNIKSGLQKCDIVQETFSVFTSRYPEVMTMQVDCLLGIWLSGGEEESKAVREKLDEKLDGYAAGKLGHAAETVVCIWEASHKGESDPSDSPDTASFSIKAYAALLAGKKFTGCDIRSSLVKSIKDGNLLDRKYWARRSREGAIEPIYFSNAVISAEFLCFDALLGRHLGSGGRLDESSENDSIEDSDCGGESIENEPIDDSDYEDEPEPADESVSQDTEVNSEGKEGQKLLPVLRVGSSAAWKSLFFYLLTGEIRFAPLKSQGLMNRLLWVLERTKPGSPAPCSPKVTYQLAKKLSWKDKLSQRTLSELALKDIEKKLVRENIATETFSSFAARYPEVLATGWKHLSTHLKTERTGTSVLGLIKSMQAGDETHRVDALKFGLYCALRQKGPAKKTLALLRCSSEKCSANANPISFDAVRGKVICPRHRVSTPSMMCSECGHTRVDYGNWCGGCRKLFG